MMHRSATSICLIALSALTLSASDCNKSSPQGKSCEGVMCTMQFAMVTVSVRDADANPVSLDSAVTIGKSGRVIATGAHMGNGVYTVADDGYQKALALRSEDVVFRGFIAGRQVVEGTYTIEADCCHVSRKSGPETLVVK